MLKLQAELTTSASPEEALRAAYDFTERRARIWPNVRLGHFEVHTHGERFAEATEELWPFGVWERCRYEWSQPGCVRAIVLDSNVLAPGSSWELRARPAGDGARVEATYLREFRSGPRARFARVLNRIAGNRLARSDLHKAMKALER